MIKWPDPEFKIQNANIYDEIHVGHNGPYTKKEHLWASVADIEGGHVDPLTEKLLDEMIQDTTDFLNCLKHLKYKIKEQK